MQPSNVHPETMRKTQAAQEPSQRYATSKPRTGMQIDYMGKPYGIATSVEGGLCWTRKFGSDESLPFIWCFKDGVNALHNWPNKVIADEAFCPDHTRQQVRQ